MVERALAGIRKVTRSFRRKRLVRVVRWKESFDVYKYVVLEYGFRRSASAKWTDTKVIKVWKVTALQHCLGGMGGSRLKKVCFVIAVFRAMTGELELVCVDGV